MISTFAFLVCVWLAQSAQAQVVGLGKCPKVTPVADFTPSSYLGKWYEYARYFDLAETGNKCVTTTYEPSLTAGVYNVTNIGYRLGLKSTIKGTAKPASDDNSGIFTVKFDTNLPGSEATHYIIGTDYESYAVVWSCKDAGNLVNTQQSWILTRARKPIKLTIDAAYAALTKNDLSTSKLSVVDQTDCEKYESS